MALPVAFVAGFLQSCAEPPEGRYRLHDVQYVFDPQGIRVVNNAFHSASPTTTTTPGSLSTEPYTPFDGPVADSSVQSTSGLAGELHIDGDEVVFVFGTAALVGAPEGDGWTVRFTDEYQFAARTTSPGGYWFEEVGGSLDEFEIHLVASEEGRLHGEGTVTLASVSGFRESDEWDAEESGVDGQLLGVYTASGNEVKNVPGRDDCAGDHCEVLAFDRYANYLLTFEGEYLGP